MPTQMHLGLCSRSCTAALLSGYGGGVGEVGPRFFDYARYHGPLALFETKTVRHGVMGQCEDGGRYFSNMSKV